MRTIILLFATLFICQFAGAQGIDYTPKSYVLDYENTALMASLNVVQKETTFDSTFRLYQVFTSLLAKMPELDGYTYVPGLKVNGVVPSFWITNGTDTLGRVFEIEWNKAVSYELELAEGNEFLEFADYEMSEMVQPLGRKNDGTILFRVMLYQHSSLAAHYGAIPAFMRAIKKSKRY